MTRTTETIRPALDAALSGVSRDPALYADVISAAKGEAAPVKRKLTLSMAFVLILLLLISSAAIAVAYRGVSYFMFEMYGDPVALDEDYLISGMEQSHSNPLVNVSVTDAYWDGVDLSIAYHVSPVDPNHSIRVDCDSPAHDHYRPIESADIQLDSVDLLRIAITDHETGAITRPHHCGSNWVYEADDSLSVFNSFTLNSMSGSATVSIPISVMLLDSGEQFDSILHYQLPVLDDPVAEHEHEWLPATCGSPTICTICGRGDNELGDHNYQLSPNETCFVCIVCGVDISRYSMTNPTFTLKPGDASNIVLTLNHRLSELGYYSGILHGKYDDATTQAVKAFQESVGMIADGICTPETLRKLFPQ